MSEVTWTHPFLTKVLKEIPLDTKALIDVGCGRGISGRGIIGALTRIYREPKRLVGVDVFQPYLNFCKKFNFYDELYCLDLRKLPLPFKSKDFDVVTCIEVIEHLPKKDGEKLLDEIERLAKLVIVTTPTTFFSQENYDHNPFQKHVSSWTLADFRKRNYDVKGFGGFLIRRKRIRYISSFLTPLCEKWFPQFTVFLLAKKRT